MIWTTTPWTLPANVAAAVHPEARLRQTRERRVGDGGAASRTRPSRRSVPGAELVGLRYEGPFDTLPPGAEVEHRVISWDEVSVDEGTGIVHIAPGLRRRGLRAVARPRPAHPHARRRGGAVLRRLRLAARYVDRRRGRPDRRRPGRARAARARRPLRASLPALLALRHAAHLPHLRRLVPLRRGAPPAAPRCERDGRVDAGLHGQAHGRLAAEHGRLEHLAPPLLRLAAAVLPLWLRAAQRGRVEAGAARARDRAGLRAAGAAPPVGRRRQDPLRGMRRGGRADRRGG